MRKILILAAVVAGAVLAPATAMSAPTGLTAPAPVILPGPLFEATKRLCFDKAENPQAILTLAEADGWTLPPKQPAATGGESYRHMRFLQKGSVQGLLMLSDRPFENGGRSFPISLCSVSMDKVAGSGAREDVERWLGLMSDDEHDGLAVWLVQPTGSGFVKVKEDAASMEAALKAGPLLSIAVKYKGEPVTIFYGVVHPPKN